MLQASAPDVRTAIVDYAVVAWLAFTSVLLLHHPAAPAHVAHVLLHVLAIALVLGARYCLRQRTQQEWMSLRWVHAWYPFMMLPLIYKELDMLSPTTNHDALVLQWEWALFGSSPAEWMSQALPYPWLSELLHACYITFYLMLPILGLTLLFSGQRETFQAMFWSAINLFFLGYLTSIIFPVEGPRPLMPPIDLPLQGFFWRVSHAVLNNGAASRAAFPSGHVAHAVLMACFAWRWNRRLFPLFLLWALGVGCGTVYGRFHYLVDSLAGVAAACVMAWAGPASFRWLTESAAVADDERGYSILTSSSRAVT